MQELMDELEFEGNDESLLDEIEEKKKAAKKSFSSVINRKRLNKYELDEVMV